MPTGLVRACRQSSSGSVLRWTAQSKEILSKTRIFTHAHCPPLEKIDIFARCLATFGNGRAAPTRLTQATAQRPARSASTTANLCAINTSYAVVPAPPPARTSAAPIAISFNRKNAGSSPESDSHATHSKSLGRVTLCAPVQPHNDRRFNHRSAASFRARIGGLSGGCYSWFVVESAHHPVQIFL